MRPDPSSWARVKRLRTVACLLLSQSIRPPPAAVQAPSIPGSSVPMITATPHRALRRRTDLTRHHPQGNPHPEPVEPRALPSRAGPAPAALAHVTTSLADLTMLEGDELPATPVPGSPWDHRAEATLTAWARRVGHRRIWLPERVATLDELPELDPVLVTCPTCGARWEDATVDFWTMVHDHGRSRKAKSSSSSRVTSGRRSVAPASATVCSV